MLLSFRKSYYKFCDGDDPLLSMLEGISSASIAGSVFMFHDALECIPIKYCLLLWRQLDMNFLVRGCTKELEVLCRLHWSKAEFIIFDSGLTN
ncbi:hypothetical protein Tco_1514813 [Tanacetum coccineum]